jgi:hypothetical protein
MAIVVSDLSFLRAVERSVVTIWTRVATTAALAMATMVVPSASAFAYWVAADALRASQWTRALTMFPFDVMYEVALAVVGAWAIAALFVWYREAYPLPVVAPLGPIAEDRT